MNRKLLLVGGGGHCNSIIDVLEESQENQFSEIAIIDLIDKVGSTFLKYKIIGTDEQLEAFYGEGYTHAFISLGGVGVAKKRSQIYEQLISIGFEIPNIISKSAILSNRIIIGEGNFIGKGAIVNAGAVLGNNIIVNTGAIVEHDCRIGDYGHIAPGCVLSGGVRIGYGSHLGTNSTVIQNVNIEENVVIGAGSVVVRDTPKNSIAYGVPSKRVRDK